MKNVLCRVDMLHLRGGLFADFVQGIAATARSLIVWQIIITTFQG
jgi:hypothetical protein